MLVLEIAVGVFIALVAKNGLDALVRYREHQETERRKREAAKEAISCLTDLLTKIKQDHDHDARLEEALEKATVEIKKGSTTPLKPSQYPAVEKRFHELTGDHYLKLEKAANGKADVTISDTPFKKPARKKAPVKKPVKKSMAVVDKSQPAKVKVKKGNK